jgi:hypothetical protein
MKKSAPYGWLLRTTARVLKYFLLSLAGCTVAYCVSAVLDLAHVVQLLTWLLEQVMPRALVLVMCLGTIAVITESLRH